MKTTTIYVCPCEGIVPKNVSHTHTYTMIEDKDNITINIINNGFLCVGTEYYTLTTTKQQILETFNNAPSEFKERLNGNIHECLKEMNEDFIETIVLIMADFITGN